MMREYDILLPGPLPQIVLRVLLFLVFELHLAFALLTLGLAIIAGIELMAGRSPIRALRTFSMQKSLAVVIGVGVLILMLVFEPIPMLRGINRVGSAWLTLVVLLIIALAGVESTVHMQATPWRRRILFATGLLTLLAVPAVFSAMVVSVENPGLWQRIDKPLDPWSWRLLAHYGARLAHVLGAAVVFSAGFLLLWGRPPVSYTARLRRWMQTAIWVQVIGGILLLVSLPHRPVLSAIISIVIAVTAVAIVAKGLAHPSSFLVARRRHWPVAGLLLVLLTGMLLARQILQDQVLLPLDRQLRHGARRYSAILAKAELQPPSSRPSDIPVRSNPAVIYGESCMFCHGGVGNGEGTEAYRLRIPPEDLTAIRSTRPYLYQVLRKGIPGSAMPVFDYYSSDELNDLIGFLSQLGLRDRPEPLPVALEPGLPDIASQVFRSVCADCHGQDGRGNGPRTPTLSPKPPDFTRYTISPNRAVRVITWSYPGTAMPAFYTFPQGLRWALASTVNGLYHPPARD